MSQPRTDYADILAGICVEIMSARSSLHMDDAILPGCEHETFLDEKYTYVLHAKKHLQCAYELYRRLL